MSWVHVADSHIGDRNEQQDRYLVVEGDSPDTWVLVVADGVGGHEAGALAAQSAIECVLDNLETLWNCDQPEHVLDSVIKLCNERVVKISGVDTAGSTLVLVLIRGDEVYWGHVGDSRFYLIRNGKTVARTTDHTLAELEHRSPSDDEYPGAVAQNNHLYMCLGVQNDIVPEVASSLVRPGDNLVLCSDGLWNQIDIDLKISELNESKINSAALDSWVQAARKAKPNQSDNITLIVSQFSNEVSPIKRLIGTLIDHLKIKR